ncbi:alpha/beta fold hydrolase [Paraliobacillus ryukyuensis]|uniref:alpha/beta fold hydrolase n=1 Tax=Paraliobacillus ryukyuensis TaxID=200904 RepID=UPI0011BD8CA3|nr:hypothetical protein [Paraliobacillus ryukyuensis]
MNIYNREVRKISNNTSEYFVKKVGCGESIIFLPAGGFSGNEGLNIAEHLKEKFETHLIDLPGLGKSKSIDGKVTSLTLANWVKKYLDQAISFNTVLSAA